MKNHSLIILCLSLLLSAGHNVFAQRANIWHFGDFAGIDFNGLAPVAITGGQMSTNEGCASICDNSGNLLFYTDGVRIWNAAHTVVNPSSLMFGHASSTQSAVIIPRPGSADRYFIFTQDQWGVPGIGCTNGLNWTEVQVSGLSITIVSLNNNLQPCSLTTEKVTAVCHANGTDYWAITVLSDGQFVSYPITAAGVGTAVVSSVTAVPCLTSGFFFNDDKVGYMKVSWQGDLLALARRHSSSVNELFDFDNSTGLVTNNRGTYRTGTTYGVEFSPDGAYFYTTDFQNVRQHNTSSLASTIIHTDAGNVGALQLGPDGNIYVANGYEGVNSSFIDRIETPNSPTPTYADNFLSLPGTTHSRLGLPDIVNCLAMVGDCEVKAGIKYEFNEETCSYEFFDNSTVGPFTQIVSWQWTFGDGTSSSEQNPVHYYAEPGTYKVCLRIVGFNGQECCVSERCIELKVEERECMKAPCRIEPGMRYGNTDPCHYVFSGTVSYSNTEIVAWLWDFGDGNTASGQNVTHTYSGPGDYVVCLTIIGYDHRSDNGCCVFRICETVRVDCPEQHGNHHRSEAPSDGSPAIPSSSGIEKTGQNELRIYPNPTRDRLSVEILADVPQMLEIRLVDMAGKIYPLGRLSYTDGLLLKELQLNDIAPGVYMLWVEGDNFRETRKLQIGK